METIGLQVSVVLPESTPTSATIFLAGSGPALGDWSADGVPLTRTGRTEAQGELHLPPGWRGECLLTLGHWQTVEVDARGRERPPRPLQASPRGRLELEVLGWGRTTLTRHTLPSAWLHQERTVVVYRPPGYDLETERRYSVLYFQDGQNLFDPAEAFGGQPWYADQAAERVARNHTARPLILVGVYNSPQRLEEYGPRRSSRGAVLSKARRYARFLVEELKPFIDAQYRTTPDAAHTGIAGSSLGGLMALHLAKWYPQVFGVCAALSPSLWFDREFFLSTIGQRSEWLKQARVWIDMGDQEGGPRERLAHVRRTIRLAEALEQQGRVPGRDFQHYIDIGAGHHELAWRHRLPRVLQFLFPPLGRPAG